MEISIVEILAVVGTLVTIVARLFYIRSQIHSKNRHNKKEPPRPRVGYFNVIALG